MSTNRSRLEHLRAPAGATFGSRGEHRAMKHAARLLILPHDLNPPTVRLMRAPAKIKGPGSAEKLSIEEIWRRYPNEWVVLVDTDWDGVQETEGVVFAHSPKKDEARAAARGLRLGALYWTGEI